MAKTTATSATSATSATPITHPAPTPPPAPPPAAGIVFSTILPGKLAESVQQAASSAGKSIQDFIAELVTRYHRYPLNDPRGAYLTGEDRAEIELAAGHAIQSPKEIAQLLRDAATCGFLIEVEDGKGGTRKVPVLYTIDAYSMTMIHSRNYDQLPTHEYVRTHILKKALELFVNGAF